MPIPRCGTANLFTKSKFEMLVFTGYQTHNIIMGWKYIKIQHSKQTMNIYLGIKNSFFKRCWYTIYSQNSLT